MSSFEGRNKNSKNIIIRGNQGFLVVYYFLRLKIDTGFVPEFCYLQSKSQKTITAGATEDHRKSFVIF
jgi:hypothetical protein